MGVRASARRPGFTSAASCATWSARAPSSAPGPDNARISGNAVVADHVGGNAKVYGSAVVKIGHTNSAVRIVGNAEVSGTAVTGDKVWELYA